MKIIMAVVDGGNSPLYTEKRENPMFLCIL